MIWKAVKDDNRLVESGIEWNANLHLFLRPIATHTDKLDPNKIQLKCFSHQP